MKTEEDQRKAFEAWWQATMNTEVMDLYRNIYPGGKGVWNYACHETNRAWMAWQAALAAQPSPAAVERKPLTWDQITDMTPGTVHCSWVDITAITRAVEAAHAITAAPAPAATTEQGD